jgi:hypothetical protein
LELLADLWRWLRGDRVVIDRFDGEGASYDQVVRMFAAWRHRHPHARRGHEPLSPRQAAKGPGVKNNGGLSKTDNPGKRPKRHFTRRARYVTLPRDT